MSPLPANTNPPSVEWITANATRLLEDQQRRAESLQSRAGQLAGFAGATVALAAPLARTGLHQTAGDLRTIAAVAFFVAAGALGAVITLSVVFVLRPVMHKALGADEIDAYLTDSRFLTQTPQEIQFRTLKALKRAVERYEAVNKSKAFWLKITSILYLVGLLSAVALAVTLAADRL